MMGHLRKAMNILQEKKKIFRGQANAELDQARAQGIASTTRGVNIWLTKIVKIFVQEELVKAKIKQLLAYNDEVTFAQEASDSPTVSESKVASVFEREDPEVTGHIQTFAFWIEERISPTEDEVMLCAKSKAAVIMDQIQHVFIENQLPG